ncbi:GNAT family N-acetyltransferase [Vagococcus fluvialis]|uniref:GNAT family N-acetyltransferase n=1 Tax=Vagococcus fluvialis TaxID=2738 RepID=UPI001A8FF301|nr:GNAT family N-acetyltransferase [Vagococcus fluvialis]MBO0428163.1 GNAT family N-acetyltransferase [Vagococcus fluvialis]
MIKNTDKITEKELDRIIDIWLASNIEAHPFVDQAYWKSHQEEVREALPHSDLSYYEIDGEIVGFIGIVDGYIAGIFVDSQYRGKRIGKQLLDDAKAKNNHLELSVYKENKAAIHFYLREEFKIIKEEFDEETNQWDCLMEWEK